MRGGFVFRGIIKLMTEMMIVVLLSFLGLVMGSFAGAQVWRLRARQLRDDEDRLDKLKSKRKLSKDESEEKAYLQAESKTRRQERSKLDVLLDKAGSQDRSRCLKCSHKLAWYDLLPLVSWLSTGGKCRYCRRTIGLYEPIVELVTAGLFVASYVFWPLALASQLDWLVFVVWLIATVLMVVLFVYDKKWFILPDKINFSLVGVAAVFAGLVLLTGDVDSQRLASLAGSVAIMSGLYLILYLLSSGAWIGFGDVKLGVGLGLLLGQWQLAFLALFLANLIGTLLVVPGLITGRLSRQSQVPFGPLLIAGTVLTVLFGQIIIDQFFRVSLGLF